MLLLFSGEDLQEMGGGGGGGMGGSERLPFHNCVARFLTVVLVPGSFQWT